MFQKPISTHAKFYLYLFFFDFLIQVIVFCKYEHAFLKNTSFLPRQSCHLTSRIDRPLILYVQNKHVHKTLLKVQWCM